MVTACIRTGPRGIILNAMTGMNYIESDLPEMMTLLEWRRARSPRRSRRMPRMRLRFA